MKIESITARELRMRLKAPFETSSSITLDRRVLLIEVRSDGFSGWGEITVDDDPYYNSETTDTAWHILRDFIVPLTLGKTVATAGEAGVLMSRIRGHEMARAGLENALWDIESQRLGIPLHQLLGGTLTEIPCGVSWAFNLRRNSYSRRSSGRWLPGISGLRSKLSPAKTCRRSALCGKSFQRSN